MPLFDDNGKKTIDGIMVCVTCHDPHRRDPSSMVTKDHFDIEGNSKNSFLRLETSPAPRLCESCHPDKAYIEKTDHDLITSAPFSKNIIDQTPIESGTCGVCHLVHNCENKIALWAQGFGAGNNIMEMMCNFCHSKLGPAKNKIPQVYLHPREKLIKNTGRNISGLPDYFPLFNGRTGEPVTEGNLSCPSCHNAHQWDPENADKGKGGNIEDDLNNSFLRPKASRTLCLDCHKTDAFSKFENFHDPTKRKYKGINELFF